MRLFDGKVNFDKWLLNKSLPFNAGNNGGENCEDKCEAR